MRLWLPKVGFCVLSIKGPRISVRPLMQKIMGLHALGVYCHYTFDAKIMGLQTLGVCCYYLWCKNYGLAHTLCILSLYLWCKNYGLAHTWCVLPLPFMLKLWVWKHLVYVATTFDAKIMGLHTLGVYCQYLWCKNYGLAHTWCVLPLPLMQKIMGLHTLSVCCRQPAGCQGGQRGVSQEEEGVHSIPPTPAAQQDRPSIGKRCVQFFWSSWSVITGI